MGPAANALSRTLVVAGLAIAALIHLAPLVGVLGGERLAGLYGREFEGPDLQILMRHRAVLFGLLGAFLLAAVFRPAWRTPAFVAGGVSVVAFLALAASVGGYNAALARIVFADQVALAALAVGALAHWRARRG